MSNYAKQYASEDEKRKVWAKGRTIPNLDSTEWRKDACGATMRYSQHGNRNSEYGWEIDHIVALTNGGSDSLSNKQPLQWRNNAAKGDHAPGYWSCAVTT